jgi:hypothetical protein
MAFRHRKAKDIILIRMTSFKETAVRAEPHMT